MVKICDNKSVGQIIYRGNELLMIERKNFPQSLSLPAGHLDGDTFEEAAIRETQEEVNIKILKNKLVWKKRIPSPCKRENGTFHEVEIYKALEWEGEPRAGDDAKSFFWATPEKLSSLISRTEYFVQKYNIPFSNVKDLTRAIFGTPEQNNIDPEWIKDVGIEPVWCYILRDLKWLA